MYDRPSRVLLRLTDQLEMVVKFCWLQLQSTFFTNASHVSRFVELKFYSFKVQQNYSKAVLEYDVGGQV